MNFSPNQTISNAGVVSVNPANGQFTMNPSGSTHAVVDVYGIFGAPMQTALACSTRVSNYAVETGHSWHFANTQCPSGTTAVSAYCWNNDNTLIYSGGSGIDADGSNKAFCEWVNYTGGTATVLEGARCCSLP